MSDIFESVTRPSRDLFFRRSEPDNVCLGEIVPETNYEEAEIVILGCPQDEGVRRNEGRPGARLAPDHIRRQFYQLTPFGLSAKIFDAGNIEICGSLEETHERQTGFVEQVLRDGKKVIALGGGNDIAYADGKAMAAAFGPDRWLGISIDAQLNVGKGSLRHNGTPFRQLLEENLILPDYFYSIAFQPHFISPAHYRYLQELGVNLVSLEQLRSRETTDLEIRELVRQKFINHSNSLSTYFGFDLGAVRASDAPGVTEPSPIGLRAGEFLNLVTFAAKLVNTKIIEFTEVNPNFDVDDRTAKLVAIAMHRFCSLI